jgi:hypothetical protein
MPISRQARTPIGFYAERGLVAVSIASVKNIVD